MKSPTKILPLLILIRPINCLITALSVAVGALTADRAIFAPPVLLAALSAALIGGAGNAFNDVLDVEIDRINRPARPLPAGRLGPGTALCEALLLALTGWILSWLIGPVHFFLAGAVIGLLAAYSMFLKNSVLWGNIAVALTASIAFPYGALAAGAAGRSWIPAGFSLLFHLGREIVKDIEDVEGDQALGLSTMPVRWGCRPAAWTASVLYLFLIAFTILPWRAGIYGSLYLGCVLLVDLLVFYALARLWASGVRPHDDTSGRLLKAGMFLGLLAIVAGELSR